MMTNGAGDSQSNAPVSALEGDLVRVPWWVHALDIATVAAAILALLAAVGAGSRFRAGPFVISLLAPGRLFAWAASFALLRHALYRRPPVTQQIRLWPEVVRRWASRWPSLDAVAMPFLLSRLLVLLVGYLAVSAIGYAPGHPVWRSSPNEILNLPSRWDAGWYRLLARDGYTWNGTTDVEKVAFFPAYPMAVRAVAWITGSVDAAAFLVAIVAFLFALIYLFRLARLDLAPAAAQGALLFLAFYPFGIFYCADYTESLFLLAIVGAVYHFRCRQWLRAAAWAAVVGLARPNGFALSPVLAVLAVEGAWRTRRRWRAVFAERRRLLSGLIVAASPIAGLALYCVFVYRLTGDPFAWIHAQRAWGRGAHGLSDLAEWTRTLWRVGLYQYSLHATLQLLNVCAALFAIFAVWPVGRRFGVGYALLIVANIVPPLISGGSMSIGRFTSVLFPIFLWLGAVVPVERRALWIAVFCSLQAFAATVFFTWRGVIT